VKDKKCDVNCIYCHIFNENNFQLNDQGIKYNKKFAVGCDFYGDLLTSWRKCNHYIDRQEIQDNLGLNQKEYIFVFIGASASGKDTAIRYLQNKYGIVPIISHTTRPIRKGERQDVDYHFINKTNFNKMKKQQMFFDERKYNTFDPNTKSGKDTWYYGMAKSELLKLGHKACAVDLTGLQNLVNYIGIDNLVVFCLTTDEPKRKSRAQERGGYDENEWNRRADSDKDIFTLQNLDVFSAQGIKINEIQNNGSLDKFYGKIEEAIKPYLT